VETCYRQALSSDDSMLLPHLTPGEYLKLRSLGLHTLSQAVHWFQDNSTVQTKPLTPQQTVSLRARVQALAHNRIDLLSPTTPLCPARIGKAIFVHGLRDPISGRPRAWGLQRVIQGAPSEAPHCWIAASDTETPTCQQEFLACLNSWWREATVTNQE